LLFFASPKGFLQPHATDYRLILKSAVFQVILQRLPAKSFDMKRIDLSIVAIGSLRIIAQKKKFPLLFDQQHQRKKTDVINF
jgi:hypothetical protein